MNSKESGQPAPSAASMIHRSLDNGYDGLFLLIFPEDRVSHLMQIILAVLEFLGSENYSECAITPTGPCQHYKQDKHLN